MKRDLMQLKLKILELNLTNFLFITNKSKSALNL